MIAAYLALELRRIARDPVTLFFTTGLPALMYVIFGISMPWGKYPIGNGNISMYMMIGMAAYGAVTATTGVGGMAAVERMQGWGRQLGLTALHDWQFVLVKSLVAMIVAAVPVTLVYGIGLATRAEAPASTWLWSYPLALLGSAGFALYGLNAGLLFRSENAVSGAAGMLVILGFLGNVFTPLSGKLLLIAKFTPLYGYVALARAPLTRQTIDTNTGDVFAQPLWQGVVNVSLWTVGFALLALLLVRRSRARQ